jgi:hypothetical protein
MNRETLRRAWVRLTQRRAPPAGAGSSEASLIGYTSGAAMLDIRPAPLDRDWMNATFERHAYRCLPLNIANGYGWEILCTSGFTARWNGGTGIDAVAVEPDAGAPASAASHFGYGTLTFHLECLFRTGPGTDLMVQGPINRPKDAIAPLSGIVETDWSPYSFTMNWLFTRPDTVIRFEKGEPCCHIFPVRRGELEAIKPELRPLADDPELKRQHDVWMEGRGWFNARLKRPGSQARAEKWQKLYQRGVDVEGREAVVDHRTRLRLKPFARKA